jgi:hypothetical protein
MSQSSGSRETPKETTPAPQQAERPILAKGTLVSYRDMRGTVSRIDHEGESYEIHLGGDRYKNVLFESPDIRALEEAEAKVPAAAAVPGDMEAQIQATANEIRVLKAKLNGEGIIGKQLKEHPEMVKLVERFTALRAPVQAPAPAPEAAKADKPAPVVSAIEKSRQDAIEKLAEKLAAEVVDIDTAVQAEGIFKAAVKDVVVIGKKAKDSSNESKKVESVTVDKEKPVVVIDKKSKGSASQPKNVESVTVDKDKPVVVIDKKSKAPAIEGKEIKSATLDKDKAVVVIDKASKVSPNKLKEDRDGSVVVLASDSKDSAKEPKDFVTLWKEFESDTVACDTPDKDKTIPIAVEKDAKTQDAATAVCEEPKESESDILNKDAATAVCEAPKESESDVLDKDKSAPAGAENDATTHDSAAGICKEPRESESDTLEKEQPAPEVPKIDEKNQDTAAASHQKPEESEGLTQDKTEETATEDKAEETPTEVRPTSLSNLSQPDGEAPTNADSDGQKKEAMEASEPPEQMLPSPEEPSADYQLQSEAESSEGQLSDVGDGAASKETQLETDFKLASDDEQIDETAAPEKVTQATIATPTVESIHLSEKVTAPEQPEHISDALHQKADSPSKNSSKTSDLQNKDGDDAKRDDRNPPLSTSQSIEHSEAAETSRKSKSPFDVGNPLPPPASAAAAAAAWGSSRAPAQCVFSTPSTPSAPSRSVPPPRPLRAMPSAWEGPALNQPDNVPGLPPATTAGSASAASRGIGDRSARKPVADVPVSKTGKRSSSTSSSSQAGHRKKLRSRSRDAKSGGGRGAKRSRRHEKKSSKDRKKRKEKSQRRDDPRSREVYVSGSKAKKHKDEKSSKPSHVDRPRVADVDRPRVAEAPRAYDQGDGSNRNRASARPRSQVAEVPKTYDQSDGSSRNRASARPRSKSRDKNATKAKVETKPRPGVADSASSAVKPIPPPTHLAQSTPQKRKKELLRRTLEQKTKEVQALRNQLLKKQRQNEDSPVGNTSSPFAVPAVSAAAVMTLPAKPKQNRPPLQAPRLKSDLPPPPPVQQKPAAPAPSSDGSASPEVPSTPRVASEAVRVVTLDTERQPVQRRRPDTKVWDLRQKASARDGHAKDVVAQMHEKRRQLQGLMEKKKRLRLSSSANTAAGHTEVAAVIDLS